jgi:2-haloacid dehalogenase
MALAGTAPIHGILFDAYGTLFDVYSVGNAAQQRFPGRGHELALLWRQKQLEYCWLRTLSNRYKPFWALTRDALRFSARRLGLDLDDATEQRLMDEYARLAPFPENLGALRQLRLRGLPLGILSNGDPQMLAKSVNSAGMDGLFDHLLSVDAVRRYKTTDDAYALGTRALGVPAAEILFVSSNCWDAIGAAWFGYRSFWINRGGQPAEELDTMPAASGHLLTDVVAYLDGGAQDARDSSSPTR